MIDAKNRQNLHLDSQKTYALFDFDGTITKGVSDSSWSSIFKAPNVKEDFVNACLELFNYYHPLEIDENISLLEKTKIMDEWYQKNIETLKNYKIEESTILSAVHSQNSIILRDGTKDF